MKKTLIKLDEEIYEELVKLSIKKYGNARHLSDVLNDMLKERLGKRKEMKVKMHFSVTLEKADKLTPEVIDRIANEEISSS
jgi:predicted CopG family antitoxin